MTPQNRKKLANRVAKAAGATLAAQKYVRPIDVLVGIGWLDRHAEQRWRKGQINYLERVVEANLSRISEAMKLFRSWASKQGLVASETDYVRRKPGRPALRFSKSGHPNIERQYRTHWVTPKLAAQIRERQAAKARRARKASEGVRVDGPGQAWPPESALATEAGRPVGGSDAIMGP